MATGRVASHPRTLAIDIGGSGLKMMTLGPTREPASIGLRQPTPSPALPEDVLSVLDGMAVRQPGFDRVAVGFPGVIRDGVTLTAANLHAGWVGFDLAAALHDITGRPTRVANDADVQGLAVIEGIGVEFVRTLGTGLCSALYVDGALVPNLEIAHHEFRKNRTYEEYLGKKELKRHGKAKWNRLLRKAIHQLERTLNYRRLYVGGGNAKRTRPGLPIMSESSPTWPDCSAASASGMRDFSAPRGTLHAASAPEGRPRTRRHGLPGELRGIVPTAAFPWPGGPLPSRRLPTRWARRR